LESSAAGVDGFGVCGEKEEDAAAGEVMECVLGPGCWCCFVCMDAAGVGVGVGDGASVCCGCDCACVCCGWLSGLNCCGGSAVELWAGSIKGAADVVTAGLPALPLALALRSTGSSAPMSMSGSLVQE
jgi:hypothetical protein